MRWAHAMTFAWFGRMFRALSGGRRLQDSEEHARCPVLGQGRYGGAPTAVYEGGAAGGPRMLSSWCPVATGYKEEQTLKQSQPWGQPPTPKGLAKERV